MLAQEDMIEVALYDIHVNPHQPRRSFSADGLEELADSIQAVGLLQPPVVHRVRNGYELIAGERRVRACQLAGLKRISVIVKNSTHEHSAQAALVENVQRIDLNPIEIAQALHSLVDQFGFSQKELAQRIGKKRSTVANYLRLLSLPPVILESIQKGSLSMGHAKVILSLSDLDKQLALHKKMIQEKLTVREAETIMKKIAPPARKAESPGNLFLEEIRRDLEKSLGSKVTIQPKDRQGHRGQIIIDYYNLDNLDHLIQVLS